MNWRKQLPFLFLLAGIYFYMEYDARQHSSPSHDASRFQAWPMEFREGFVQQCSAGVGADKAVKFEVVCRCFAKRLEAEHILPVTYDTKYSDPQRFSKDLSQRMNVYFQTEAGRLTRETCAEDLRATSSEPDPQ